MDSNKHKGYSEWVKAKAWDHDALNLLQLDHFDRSVIKVAGKFPSAITCTISLKSKETFAQNTKNLFSSENNVVHK